MLCQATLKPWTVGDSLLFLDWVEKYKRALRKWHDRYYLMGMG